MDLNSRLAQARALRDRGDLAAAEASFSEAVERFPQDASALIDWADVAMRRRDWREAQRRCGLLRERFPEHSFGYVAGARALRDAGDLAAAESLSAGVVERFPQDAGGLIDWADLAMRRRDWPEAQRRCALLRERFSEHSFGYVVGARALRDAGDLAAAESLFAEAVERFPQDAGALLDWADVAMRRRDWSEAQRRCVLLRERFPEHSFGYVVGARALRDAGDLDAAEALFAKAAERFPREAGALIDWADAAIRRCDWGEAQHRCALVRERFPEHWFGYVAGARALRDAGDLAAAEALFGEAVERFPQDVGIVVDWIDCSARRGDWKEARRRAEEAQKQLPHEWLPVLALMRMLREGGWEDDLSDVIKKALDQFPQRVELLREAAEVARRRDEFAEAVSLLDRVCKIMPEDVTAHMRLADVLVELGDWRRCQQVLEATLKSLTSDYDIFRAAAFLATRTNDGVWLTGRWPLLLRHVRANDQNGVEQCLDLFRHFGAEPFRYTLVEWIFNERVSELPKNYVPLAVRLLYQLQYRALWGEVWEDIRSYAIGRRHEVIDPIESLLIASLCGDPLTEQEAQRLIGFYIMGATSRELPLDVLVMVFGSHNASAELDSALSRLIGEFQQRDLNLNSET
ncbi:MAG TPA: tetratricopeptide repeat protein, partial [Stellaceae bacterium]|nr:tetratricopeptide repeat protein [Stellaceae bacterium]